MSGRLRIRFGHDLPPMAVEVVAPDLQVVERVMATPGGEAHVDVPSEMTFLRARLPSGEDVVLRDPGKLDRQITREDLDRAGRAQLGGAFRSVELQSGARQRKARRSGLGFAAPPIGEGEELPLGRNGALGSAWVLSEGGYRERGRAFDEPLAEWRLGGPPGQPPFELRVKREDGAVIAVRVPGNAERVQLSAEQPVRDPTRTYRVRVQTRDPVADAILNYLARGDLAAADAMSGWAEQGEAMLQSKMADPYAAAVGAYLLLRMQAFDRMHDWSRNLADWFSFIPDGCVIWAWQLMARGTNHGAEVKRYLLEAARRGIPVYAPGARLLLDGLQLLGDDGRAELARLREQLGTVVRESPLSAWFATEVPRTRHPRPVVLDIGFGIDA